MDTSKKYIEMCEKAKEIQEDWKPSFNDFCCEKDDLMNLPDRIKSVNSCADDEYSGTTDSIHYDSAKEKTYWLPRQDQLQEMVLPVLTEKYEKKSSLPWGLNVSKLNRQANWAISLLQLFLKETKLGSNSLEQLWLAFVMKEKYNKVWNGKEWIK